MPPFGAGTPPGVESDGFPTYLFAQALLLNRNYFHFFTFRPNCPPVPGLSESPIFGCPRLAPQLKRDGKIDLGFALFSRGKKVYRPNERVFSLRPAFQVIAGVFGHELFGDRAVVEIT